MIKKCEVPFKCTGHIMRNQRCYNLLQLMPQGKVYGKRGSGRISWLRILRKYVFLTATGLFSAIVNKVRIVLVAGIQNRLAPLEEAILSVAPCSCSKYVSLSALHQFAYVWCIANLLYVLYLIEISILSNLYIKFEFIGN